MCEFEFCLVEELCEDLLAMRMRDYLGRLEDAGCGTTTLEDWTQDWKMGWNMRDDDQSSFSILLNCGGVCVLAIKLE